MVTPLGENSCSSSSAPVPPAIRISELGLAGSTTPHRFVELEGKPGTSLGGLSLVFFLGKEGKARASIPLRGIIGATGLFTFALDGGHGHGEADGHGPGVWSVLKQIGRWLSSLEERDERGCMAWGTILPCLSCLLFLFFLSLFCLGRLFHQTPTEKVLNPPPCLC